jgi:hypothetical protein
MAKNEFSFTKTKKPEVKPASPEPKPAEKPPTPEEIEQSKAEMLDSLGFGGGAEKKKPAAPPEKKPEGEKPAGEAKPEEAKPEAGKPAAKTPDKIASTEDIISKTAAKTAAAVAEKLSPPKPEAEEVEDAGIELKPEDQKESRILAKLAEINPSKYGDSVKQFEDWCSKLYKYEEKWLAENPGKKFNIDDEEHAEFIEQNQPEIDEDDYEEAKIQHRVDEAYERRIAPEQRIKETRERIQAAMPTIVRNVHKGAYNLIEKINPELAALLKNEKGEIVMEDANFKKIEAADPIAYKGLIPIVTSAAQVLTSLEQISIPGISLKLDPENVPAHAEILALAKTYEDTLMKAPEDVRIVNGRAFITAADRAARIDKINAAKTSKATKQKKISELNDSTWTVGPEELSEILVEKLAAKAKASISENDELARKKYGGEKKPASPNYAPPIVRPEAGASREKPRPPQAGGGVEQVTASSPTGDGDKKFSETATEVAFAG